MLAGIYYGAQYGGSTTAILVNIPGEATSVVTDARRPPDGAQGQAGIALGIAAIGSFFAGTVATLVIAAIGAPLTKLALLFGPAEYFALMVLGLGLAVVLARGSVLKAVIMVLFGLLLVDGRHRSRDRPGAPDARLRRRCRTASTSPCSPWACSASPKSCAISRTRRRATSCEARIGRLLPSLADLRRSFGPILRGTGLGAVLGILPGNGAVLAPFASYTLEKKLAKDPSRFGRGAIEGVAGPEAANNAGAQTAFIPLLTLGIPPNAVMALMVGAMTIHGIIPGPAGHDQEPGAVLGHDRLDVDRQPDAADHQPAAGRAVGAAAQGAVPPDVPIILMFCCIGIYSINNNPADVFFTAFFGLVGYVLIKLGLEPAPMLLGFVLGQLMEEKLRQALILSGGSFMTFVERPVSAGAARASRSPSWWSRCCRRSARAATRCSRNRASRTVLDRVKRACNRG